MKYYILLLLAPLMFLASCNGGNGDANREGEAEIPVGNQVQETGALNAATIGRALVGALQEDNFDSLNNYVLSAAEVELYYKETDLHQDDYDQRYYNNAAQTIQDTLRQQFNRVSQQLQQNQVNLQMPGEAQIETVPTQLTNSIRGLQVEIPLQHNNQSMVLSCRCIKVINNYYIFNNISLAPRQ